MFCSECGKQIEDDSKFCEHCGKLLESGIVHPEPVKGESPVAGSTPVVKPPEGRQTTKTGSPQLPKASSDGAKKKKIILIVSGLVIVILILLTVLIVTNILPNYLYMVQGDKALQSHKYQEAISFYEKISADSKGYQEAHDKIKFARGMIAQAELTSLESQKDINGLDRFMQQYNGTEYEQKAMDIKNRLMDYFRTRQSQFEKKQLEFGEQYGNSINDVARSNTFNESNQWSASFMKKDNYRFYNWQGTLLTLTTSKGGNHVRARINSGNIIYIVDLTSSDPVYEKLAHVETWGEIRFSGEFQVGGNGLLEEDSISEFGKMMNPEFKIKLSDISMNVSDNSTNLTTIELVDVSNTDNLVKIILKYIKGDPEYLKGFSVATFDINADGKDDILYTYEGIGGSCGYSWNILINEGNGKYQLSKYEIPCAAKKLDFSVNTVNGMRIPYAKGKKLEYAAHPLP